MHLLLFVWAAFWALTRPIQKRLRCTLYTNCIFHMQASCDLNTDIVLFIHLVTRLRYLYNACCLYAVVRHNIYLIWTCNYTHLSYLVNYNKFRIEQVSMETTRTCCGVIPTYQLELTHADATSTCTLLSKDTTLTRLCFSSYVFLHSPCPPHTHQEQISA